MGTDLEKAVFNAKGAKKSRVRRAVLFYYFTGNLIFMHTSHLIIYDGKNTAP
jgi:hypothetical protein